MKESIFLTWKMDFSTQSRMNIAASTAFVLLTVVVVSMILLGHPPKDPRFFMMGITASSIFMIMGAKPANHIKMEEIKTKAENNA